MLYPFGDKKYQKISKYTKQKKDEVRKEDDLKQIW
jgi:hypothetical protein